MNRLNIYNKLFILFFAVLIVINIKKAPHEKSEIGGGKKAVISSEK